MPIVPVPSTISSFRDALGLALELSDEFAFVQAIAVTDNLHRCVDFGVLTIFGDGLIPALAWLSDRADRYLPSCRVILISVRSVDWRIVAERDLAEYRFAEAVVLRLDLGLLDWIETDGEVVRSYAYLTKPDSKWARQALAEGAIDTHNRR